VHPKNAINIFPADCGLELLHRNVVCFTPLILPLMVGSSDEPTLYISQVMMQLRNSGHGRKLLMALWDAQNILPKFLDHRGIVSAYHYCTTL
jgi:hypothetical protein